MTFKAGDKVRRIAGSYATMKVGDEDTVESVSGSSLRLKKFGIWHSTDNFELVEAAPTPHKWAKEIKAWADGALIEVRCRTNAPSGWSAWIPSGEPSWITSNTYEYRVKPEKTDDVVAYGQIVKQGSSYASFVDNHAGPDRNLTGDNVSFTFDGETGKLKAVQLLSNS